MSVDNKALKNTIRKSGSKNKYGLLEKNISFSVYAETKNNECVCVIGNNEALGEWNAHKCVKLKSTSSVIADQQEWRVDIQIHVPATIQYRYCICYLVDSPTCNTHANSSVIIVRWETFLEPRSVNITSSEDVILPTDSFGVFNNSELVSNGWLMGQTEIQLRFQPSAIQLKQPDVLQNRYRIKVTPKFCHDFEVEHRDVAVALANSDKNFTYITTSNMVRGKFNPIPQKPHGVLHTDSMYTIIRIQTYDPEHLAYRVDILTDCDNPASCTPFGHLFLLPFTSIDTHGTKKIPVIDCNFKSIGYVSVEYFIAKSFPRPVCDMSVSYSHYWRSRGPLEIGHRGMGPSLTPSFTGLADSTSKVKRSITENTLNSLVKAATHGADYVEFDVQLSKDRVPVIFHDFRAIIGLKTMGDKPHYEVPIKDCTVSELWRMDLCSIQKKTGFEANPFPTLQECFENVDRLVGFNIEIKYAMQMESGEYEQEHYFERNDYTDVIIDEIFKSAGSRRIVLSSFDPDICLLLRLKQNKYPVLFLSFAHCSKYPPYMDARTRSLDYAIHVALTYQLLGVSLEASLILDEPQTVSRVKEAGLIIFCWGEDTNNEEAVQTLRILGVNAVIHDRMDRNICQPNLFMKESLERLTA